MFAFGQSLLMDDFLWTCEHLENFSRIPVRTFRMHGFYLCHSLLCLFQVVYVCLCVCMGTHWHASVLYTNSLNDSNCLPENSQNLCPPGYFSGICLFLFLLNFGRKEKYMKFIKSAILDQSQVYIETLKYCMFSMNIGPSQWTGIQLFLNRLTKLK